MQCAHFFLLGLSYRPKKIYFIYFIILFCFFVGPENKSENSAFTFRNDVFKYIYYIKLPGKDT